MIFETPAWRVEHCVGPLGVGTLVVKPKRHVLGLAGLDDDEANQMGPPPVEHGGGRRAADQGPAGLRTACGHTVRWTCTTWCSPS